MLDSVRAVQASDRWNTFDKFAETAQTLARAYEACGAAVETHTAQTGGGIGTGRWIIGEAADVKGAALDVVYPVHRKVADYRDNPWHVVQWSSATPSGGTRSELVVVDSAQELDRMRPGGLAGKMVLTCMDVRSHFARFAGKAAVGVICDQPVPNHRSAVKWLKFGWGGIPMKAAGARLVGLAVSQRQGEMLRALVARHGRVVVRSRVDVRKYVGSHEVVSGLVRGRDDPQDQVWAMAHTYEPGALDNASGVATCLEIARVLEGLIGDGRLPRPRRSIRLLNGYECYGFFHELEHGRRFQPPLAGVVIDSVGARPGVCGGNLAWHATVPMSAGFVDRLGLTILRAALRIRNPGYRCHFRPFVSTSDTLMGDPKYGFPCPWLTTCRDAFKGNFYDAYHSSADTAALLSSRGLEICAAAMAAYLYYLADAGSAEVMDLASAETQYAERKIRALPEDAADQAAYLRERHHVCIERLKRWLWGGDRQRILGQLGVCEDGIARLADKFTRLRAGRGKLVHGAYRVPRRTAPLTPSLENVPPAVSQPIEASLLPPWALYWADGRHTLRDIARLVSCEHRKQFGLHQVAAFFEAHEQLEYVQIITPAYMISRRRLVAELKALGVRSGMDLMVHSSLSRIGHVIGGPDAVVDALLAVLGKSGTLLMPSFNHRGAWVFNPLATLTVNGAIPDAMWRRHEAVRSVHPTHAVAAIGRRADYYCDGDHLKAGVFGIDSPIGRLIRGGGYILALGVKHVSSTAYHVAETSVPCGCMDAFGNRDRITDGDGHVREVPGLAFRSAACPVPERGIDDALERRGLQKCGVVGRAPASLVKAAYVFNVRRAELKRACPNCRVRPAYDTTR